MASQLQQTVVPGRSPPQKGRKSYTKAEKLKVVQYYEENKNLYRTCQHFNINSKNVLRWIKNKEKIEKSKPGSRRVKFDRRGEYPDVEEVLHTEFREMRRRGVKVKGWWFKFRGKEILDLKHPGSSFKFSDGWFTRFKSRYRISLRRPTNTAQTPPDEKEAAILEFHQEIRALQLGNMDGPVEEKYMLSQIANMDQTPLPFQFSDGQTYEPTNSSSVWVRSGSSGLNKRQCTVQLTLFADGEPRVKPFVIFRGKGKRISYRERLLYDKRVTVQFQENAWCDEKMMEYWAINCWKPYILEESVLILDMHKAQKTEKIKHLLASQCKTVPVFVPPGCTSLVQPLDVVFNAPFKKKVETEAMKHMQENLEAYVEGKFSASERRILITKWVGLAWQELSQDKEMIIRGFRKCGISVAADGSEDFDINIKGLSEYHIAQDNRSEDDPFADISDEECFTEHEDENNSADEVEECE